MEYDFNRDGIPDLDLDEQYESLVAWVHPYDMPMCGVSGCGKKAQGSLIEQITYNDGEYEATEHSIVPLCSYHTHFAAEALNAIHEIERMAGLLR